jgi:hypothetical protein
MQVKDVIKQLQNEKWYKLDDHIMIGWADFDSLNGDDELTQEVWQEACARGDDNEYIFDMEMARILVSNAEHDIKHGAM